MPFLVPLCFCAFLCTPVFSAVAEELDMGMGLGIEPQAMVLITVPINTTAAVSYLQSSIDIIPNQTSHGFLIMQNNSLDDAAVQIAVVSENMQDNAPVFTINPTNFLISASSSRAIEYVITSSSLTPMTCCKWKIYAAARTDTATTAATIIEIIGHMPGADSLPEDVPLPEELPLPEERPLAERTPLHILSTVFHDKDGDGSLSQNDAGMEGVVLSIKNRTLQSSAFILQSSNTATTTITGQAIF
ncbi:MAG: hypothetical protein QME49_09120, partial [bacterium]|nr:hypothetical protein [bacterium]